MNPCGVSVGQSSQSGPLTPTLSQRERETGALCQEVPASVWQ
jgi:hypothetical protein